MELARDNSVRLVAGRRGWHVMAADGTCLGKVILPAKGEQTRVVVLRGTVGQIKEVAESGLLSRLT